MTAQIEDKFNYQGKEYNLVGISDGRLFDPSVLDIEPEGVSTACYRGYQAFFSLGEDRLILDSLFLRLLEGNREEGTSERHEYVHKKGPEINGTLPIEPPEEIDYSFNNYYEDLNYRIDYSGVY